MKFHGQNQGEKKLLIRVGDNLGTRGIEICSGSIHVLRDFISRVRRRMHLLSNRYSLE